MVNPGLTTAGTSMIIEDFFKDTGVDDQLTHIDRSFTHA
jgi:hypothetical protein